MHQISTIVNKGLSKIVTAIPRLSVANIFGYFPIFKTVFFQGIFMRYPNPFATHVLSEDTLHREFRSNGILYTRRLLTKTNKVPKWGETFMVNFKRMVPLIEESFVDRDRRTIVTYTRNVGLSRFMTAVEKVEYVANPDNPNQGQIL